jgi:hypothetical protein
MSILVATERLRLNERLVAEEAGVHPLVTASVAIFIVIGCC